MFGIGTPEIIVIISIFGALLAIVWFVLFVKKNVKNKNSTAIVLSIFFGPLGLLCFDRWKIPFALSIIFGIFLCKVKDFEIGVTLWVSSIIISIISCAFFSKENAQDN